MAPHEAFRPNSSRKFEPRFEFAVVVVVAVAVEADAGVVAETDNEAGVGEEPLSMGGGPIPLVGDRTPLVGERVPLVGDRISPSKSISLFSLMPFAGGTT